MEDNHEDRLCETEERLEEFKDKLQQVTDKLEEVEEVKDKLQQMTDKLQQVQDDKDKLVERMKKQESSLCDVRRQFSKKILQVIFSPLPQAAKVLLKRKLMPLCQFPFIPV